MARHDHPGTTVPLASPVLCLALLVNGCVSSESPDETGVEGDPAAQAIPTETETPVGDQLAGTDWRLVEFQSMSDEIGTVRPEDPTAFTMRLDADGTVSMKLDCNNATGTWSAEPGTDSTSGSFGFGPLAMTRALCAPPNLDERIARDAEYVRSYLISDGRLHLSLMADGGIYSWEPTDISEPPR